MQLERPYATHFMAFRAARLVFLCALALATPGCASAGRSPAAQGTGPIAYTEVSDRLYFGRNIPGGGEVSDAEVEVFVRDVITPAFPGGFTLLTSRGQWQEASGLISREAGFIFEVTHPPDAQVDAKIQRIAEEYKRRFRQEAVLRVVSPAKSTFYER